MDLDLENSINDRDINLEKKLLERYFEEYREKYENRISKLSSCKEFILDNSYNGHEAPHHIMYKLILRDNSTILKNPDKNIGYEFLIELDLQDIAYGIYYGCRASILGGGQEYEILTADRDWDALRGEISNILNDTFIDKNFSKRFQRTNNANNKTYWPFWISLGEEEDIIEVAVRAIKLIANCYKRNLDKIYNNTYLAEPTKKEKRIKTNTRYTLDEYNEALRKWGKDRSVFEKFLTEAERHGLITNDCRYEKRWELNISNVKFAYLFKALCNKLGYKKPAWERIQSNINISGRQSFHNAHNKPTKQKIDKDYEWAVECLQTLLPEL